LGAEREKGVNVLLLTFVTLQKSRDLIDKVLVVLEG